MWCFKRLLSAIIVAGNLSNMILHGCMSHLAYSLKKKNRKFITLILSYDFMKISK